MPSDPPAGRQLQMADIGTRLAILSGLIASIAVMLGALTIFISETRALVRLEGSEAVLFHRLPIAPELPLLSMDAMTSSLRACARVQRSQYSRLQSGPARSAIAGYCLRLADRIRIRMPTSSLAHYISALSMQGIGDPAWQDALNLSQAMGPNEGWMAERRFDLGVAAIGSLSHTAILAVEQDAHLLLSSLKYRALVIDRYARHPELRTLVDRSMRSAAASFEGQGPEQP